nr:uncharacterized protein LOC128703212 [Cherax quadricarinatus]
MLSPAVSRGQAQHTSAHPKVQSLPETYIHTYLPCVGRQRGQVESWTSVPPAGDQLAASVTVSVPSPPPRNGGLFCQGDSIESEMCDGPPCVWASQQTPAATTADLDRCVCGCTVTLTTGDTATITASAALCTGTAVWVLQTSSLHNFSRDPYDAMPLFNGNLDNLEAWFTAVHTRANASVDGLPSEICIISIGKESLARSPAASNVFNLIRNIDFQGLTKWAYYEQLMRNYLDPVRVTDPFMVLKELVCTAPRPEESLDEFALCLNNLMTSFVRAGQHFKYLADDDKRALEGGIILNNQHLGVEESTLFDSVKSSELELRPVSIVSAENRLQIEVLGTSRARSGLLQMKSTNEDVVSDRVSSASLSVAAAGGESVVGGPGVTGATEPRWGLLQGMHIAAVVFVAALMAAVVVLAVYHCGRYRLYKRARLLPESPYATPPSTPSKDPTDASSTLTLTEVISLKSLVPRPKLPVSLPLTRRGRSASYSPLECEQRHKAPQHSLPNSPFLTRRVSTPSTIRRSSSHLGRLLRRGSGTFKRKKRRFASVDELETRCISPIHETQREDDGESGKEDQVEDTNIKGEENSSKYREYRKSVLTEETTRDARLLPKLVKEKMNLERVRRSALSRSTSNATMRGSSSVSDVSVNGTDTEMEYDYYDYDMDNASAVPGSLFGMDPLVLAWAPSFFLSSSDNSPTDQGIPLNMLSLSEATPTATPTAEEAPRPNALPLQHLNIPHVDSPPKTYSMQTSIKSDEANDGSELQDTISFTHNGVKYNGHHHDDNDDDDDVTPTTHSSSSKILNLDDIQFADESEEEEEEEVAL